MMPESLLTAVCWPTVVLYVLRPLLYVEPLLLSVKRCLLGVFTMELYSFGPTMSSVCTFLVHYLVSAVFIGAI